MSEEGDSLYSLLVRLFPIARSLTGPGFRETLEILEEVTGPMERHRFATGERVFDWTIPNEWTLRDAWVKDPGGRKIIDLAESNLHVLGYSTPVHETMALAKLQEHLHSLPGQPDAIPYLTSYYSERWGFCLSQHRRDSLVEGEYEVCIDSELAPGQVEIAELTLPGESEREVLFSTYCCHPSLANNELSGPVVAAHLARRLRNLGRRRYTYRFLFLPETIGSIAYLSRFGERMRERLLAGYVLTCCGDEGAFTYKRSRRGDSLADRAAEHVLERSGRPYDVVDFFPSGSDERQYCSPGFDLPVGSLMRSMYGSYPEYHTSLDNLDFVSAEGLAGSLELYERIVETIEADDVFLNTMPFCEPQLGSRGLYPTLGSQKSRDDLVRDMMWLLNLCDGTRDLLEVAARAGRPAWELGRAAEPLLEHGLLERFGASERLSSSVLPG